MDSSNLKKSALLGAFWKFAERIGAQLVSLVVSVVLARLLTPDDYSVVGIATIFFSFCNVFITGGFNSALIRKKDADDTLRENALAIIKDKILVYGAEEGCSSLVKNGIC